MRPLEREIEDVRRRLQVLEEHACGDRRGGEIPAATAKDLASALETVLACIGAAGEQSGRPAAAGAPAGEDPGRYRTLFASAPVVLIVTDRTHIIREANRRASTLFGAAADSLAAMPLVQFLSGEDPGLLRARLDRLAGGEDLPAWETQVQPAGQAPVPVVISVSAIRDDHNRFSGFLWVFHDISLQKQREAEILEREEKFRAIVQDQTEFIFRWLPGGTITFVNDIYCRYLGATSDDVLSGRLLPSIPPEDRSLVRQNLASLTPEQPASMVEHRVFMGDGEIRWQQWTDRAIFNDRGEVAEYQSVGRDITGRKRAEEALGLTNRKLSLLADVTRHDIVNRLNVLLGYLEIAEGQTADPALQEYVLRAKEAAWGIRRYIAFTREYQSVGVCEPQWQDVRRVVRKALASHTLGEIAVDLDIPAVEIYADPMVEKAFANLLDNTLRHGETVTKVRFTCTESRGDLSLIYEDDGVGIQDCDKKRIFQRGFGKQTGLGLFLVREILSITGLAIREEGVPGEGARFAVSVPRGLYRPTDACVSAG
ncbi:PAS domain-containing sensor histidine kinase [Methanoculleus sp. FWC-SCC1]|uniref:histidine kinase n=1 Tax=Methanoculleus frigidifontis TaxID=2584085 RepID=A0ABT8MBA9_9EURY|nr:PAS domain-containing sensor histidine kinase [Methanoculleus sp. FWC-SCC1]MDN7025223.1 PAS domain-containing sensor histidine kinase [Methanoculleus sp. FWC-SCC1]